MDDYIDRQAVLNLAKDICVPTKEGYTYRHRCIDADEVKVLPSADVQPVVRCKDCKLNRKWNDWLGCPMIGIGTGVQDDDYCSRGIRKDG